MKRRSFLQILGISTVSAVLPAKAENKEIYQFGEQTNEYDGDAFSPIKWMSKDQVKELYPEPNIEVDFMEGYTEELTPRHKTNPLFEGGDLQWTNEEIEKMKVKGRLNGYKINRINS